MAVRYVTGNFRGKLGSNPRIFIRVHSPKFNYPKWYTYVSIPLANSVAAKSGYSKNQSNVVQFILRLVTNHVLLIIIIEIDSQIYSYLNFEIVLVIS
jgi:hypothetical protein